MPHLCRHRHLLFIVYYKVEYNNTDNTNNTTKWWEVEWKYLHRWSGQCQKRRMHMRTCCLYFVLNGVSSSYLPETSAPRTDREAATNWNLNSAERLHAACMYTDTYLPRYLHRQVCNSYIQSIGETVSIWGYLFFSFLFASPFFFLASRIRESKYCRSRWQRPLYNGTANIFSLEKKKGILKRLRSSGYCDFQGSSCDTAR